MKNDEKERLRGAIDFLDFVRNEGYDLAFEEIKDISASNNLTNLTGLIANTTAKTDFEAFIEMDKNRVLDIALQIFKYIFMDCIPGKDILNITNKIAITGGNNPLEGSVVLVGKSKYLLLECINKLESIPTITHESTHLLLPKIITPNFHQTEILPILVEFITSSMIEELDLSSDLLDRVIESRIEALYLRLQNQLSTSKKSTDCIIDKNIDSLEYEILRMYDANMYFTYLTSFVYASNLYYKYLEDERRLLNKLNKVISSREPVSKLTDYYDLSFSKSSTFDIPNKLLKKHS